MTMDTLVELLKRADACEKDLPPLLPVQELPRALEIAAWIDHTLLKPEATAVQVRSLCEEARQHRFAAVCVNPSYVPLAVGLLAGSKVAVCTVVGFPLGACLPSYKTFEALACLEAGAVEIDMVLNIGALKGQAYGQVLNEILMLAQVVHNQRALLKVIFETSLLTQREKIMACLLSQAAGADFVKTSTGFSTGGATVADVELMRRMVGSGMGVKASGGVRTYSEALGMIRAGATRIGTSAGIRILQEAQL